MTRTRVTVLGDFVEATAKFGATRDHVGDRLDRSVLSDLDTDDRVCVVVLLVERRRADPHSDRVLARLAERGFEEHEHCAARREVDVVLRPVIECPRDPSDPVLGRQPLAVRFAAQAARVCLPAKQSDREQEN